LNELPFTLDWGVALSSISLRGFRNLGPTSVDFAKGSNYLFGPNGAGKTNLLEAIHYLAIGRSFRRCPDADMLGFGKDVLAVSGTDECGERAEIRFDGREKRILRNDIPVEKLSEYFGWLPVVVLLLEDIELVKGAPGIRRSFLNMAISKAGPSRKDSYHKDTKTLSLDGPKSEVRKQNADGRSEGAEQAGESEAGSQEPKVRSEERSYIALIAEYRRAVSQYNRLLERSGASREPVADQLAAWEEELVLSGVPVYEARLAKVGELLENAAKHYERLAGHGAVFSYRSSVVPEGTRAEIVGRGQSPALRPPRSGTVPTISVMSPTDLANAFRQRLAATRERARALGHAVVGPHRDDIRISRGERELRKFGSVGEQRLAGIALRLAEADMILSAGRQRPVFLLDEVASELDEQRSRMVLEMVAERGQMVYAAARRIARQVQRTKDEGRSDDSVRDAGPSLDHLTTGSLDHFSGKEFHVEAGKVSEVS
jgi:DNA replication and repair protein RecF